MLEPFSLIIPLDLFLKGGLFELQWTRYILIDLRTDLKTGPIGL